MKDHRDYKVKLGQPDPLDFEDTRVSQVIREVKDLLDLRDSRVEQVLRVQWDQFQRLQDHRELQDLRDPKEYRVIQQIQEQQAQRVLLVLREELDLLAPKEYLEQERLDIRVQRVLRDFKVLPELEVRVLRD
jgi:hypothetical protein